MNKQERSPLLDVILSWVTCGIWYAIAMSKINTYINGCGKYKSENGRALQESAVTIWLLGICTCGLYTMYMYYKTLEAMTICGVTEDRQKRCNKNLPLILIVVDIVGGLLIRANTDLVQIVGVGLIVFQYAIMYIISDCYNHLT